MLGSSIIRHGSAECQRRSRHGRRQLVCGYAIRCTAVNRCSSTWR